MRNPVRLLVGEQQLLPVLVCIRDTAQEFCGADVALEANKRVFKNCVKLLRENFGGFGVTDVTLAFQMAAARELDNINLTAYQGVFTVNLFGQVLSEYRKFRNRVQVAILSEQDGAQRAEAAKRREQTHAEYKSAVVAEFRAMLESRQRVEVEKVPLPWGKILIEAGELETDPALWTLAKTRVCEQLVEKAQNLEPDVMLARHKIQEIATRIQSEPDYFPEELRTRAVNLYGRLLVAAKLNN